MLALLGIALMTWPLVDPRPLPVVVGMSVGQAFGTLSMAIFLLVVFTDLRRRLGSPADPRPRAP